MPFLGIALEALGDVALARAIVTKCTGERRLSGLWVLGRIKSATTSEAEGTIALLLPYVDSTQDDAVRSNALVSIMNICEQFPQVAPAAVPKTVAAATVTPGLLIQLNLVQTIWLHAKRIDRSSLKTVLDALKAIDPTKVGIIQQLDNAFSTLLELQDGDLVLDFLTDILSPGDSSFDLNQFQSAKDRLATGDRGRLFKLVVRWLLTGDHQLCSAVSDILIASGHSMSFDTTTQGLGLLGPDHEFLAYKAMGYLFTKPVVAASIMVASLRDCDKATAKSLGALLFDPLLVNYGGEARDYLRTIKRGDAAYGPIKKALKEADAYIKGLGTKAPVKELRPSEYQRGVERMREHEMMREVQKKAEKMSVLLSMVHRSTLLYGHKSMTFVPGPNNTRQPVTTGLHSFSSSFELPRMEIVDPVGLSMMLATFRSLKRK